MTNILILSDIHANFHALSAVMEDVGSYDLMLCAGDMVGYYDQPNEVCDYLKTLSNTHVIRGNHDAYITGDLSPDAKNVEAYKVDWTKSTLTPENMEWLGSLSPEMKMDIDGWSIIMRHANPWDEEQYIYPDSDGLLEKIHLDKRTVLVLGHTHYPMSRKCGEGLLINSGSVGQPRDRNPKASYALFDTDTGNIDFRRVSYDVASYQKHLTKLGWSNKVIKILSRTKG